MSGKGSPETSKGESAQGESAQGRESPRWRERQGRERPGRECPRARVPKKARGPRARVPKRTDVGQECLKDIKGRGCPRARVPKTARVPSATGSKPHATVRVPSATGYRPYAMVTNATTGAMGTKFDVGGSVVDRGGDVQSARVGITETDAETNCLGRDGRLRWGTVWCRCGSTAYHEDF